MSWLEQNTGNSLFVLGLFVLFFCILIGFGSNRRRLFWRPFAATMGLYAVFHLISYSVHSGSITPWSADRASPVEAIGFPFLVWQSMWGFPPVREFIGIAFAANLLLAGGASMVVGVSVETRSSRPLELGPGQMYSPFFRWALYTGIYMGGYFLYALQRTWGLLPHEQTGESNLAIVSYGIFLVGAFIATTLTGETLRWRGFAKTLLSFWVFAVGMGVVVSNLRPDSFAPLPALDLFFLTLPHFLMMHYLIFATFSMPPEEPDRSPEKAE